MASNQFLWKPVSDPRHSGRGNLVVLVPSQFSGNVGRVSVRGPNGEVLGSGKFAGRTNPDRPTFRFDQPGTRFPKGSTLQVSFSDGRAPLNLTVNNPASRITQNFNGYEPSGGTSGGGSFSFGKSDGDASQPSSQSSSGIPAPSSAPTPGSTNGLGGVRGIRMGGGTSQGEAEADEDFPYNPEGGSGGSGAFNENNTIASPRGGNFGINPQLYPYGFIPLPQADFGQSMGDARQQGQENLNTFTQAFEDARGMAMDLVDTDIAATERGLDALLPRARAEGALDTEENIRRAGQIDSFNEQRVSRMNDLNRGMFEDSLDASGVDGRERMLGVLSRLEERAQGGLPGGLSDALDRSLSNRGADMLLGSGISSVSGAGARAIDRLQVQERLNLALDADRQLPSIIASSQQLFTPPTMYNQPTDVPLNPSNFGDRVPITASVSGAQAQSSLAGQMTELQAISPTNILTTSLGSQQWNEQMRFNGELELGDRIQGQMTMQDNVLQGLINADKADEIRQQDYEALQQGYGVRQQSDRANAQGGAGGFLTNLFGSGGLLGPRGGGGSAPAGSTGSGQQGTQPPISSGPQWIDQATSGDFRGLADNIISSGRDILFGGSGGGGITPATSPSDGVYNEPGGAPPGAPVSTPASVNTLSSKSRMTGPSSGGSSGGVAQAASTETSPAQQAGSMAAGIPAPSSVTPVSPTISGRPAPASGQPRPLSEVLANQPPRQVMGNEIPAADLGASLVEMQDFWGGLTPPGSSGGKPISSFINENGDREYNLASGETVPESEVALEQRGLSGAFAALTDPAPDPKIDSQLVSAAASLVRDWGSMGQTDQMRQSVGVAIGSMLSRGLMKPEEASEIERSTQSLTTLINPNASSRETSAALTEIAVSLAPLQISEGTLDAPVSIGNRKVLSVQPSEDNPQDASFVLEDGNIVKKSSIVNSTNVIAGAQTVSVLNSNASDERKLEALTSIGVPTAQANGLISQSQAGVGMAGLNVIGTVRNWDDMNAPQRSIAFMQTTQGIMGSANNFGAGIAPNLVSGAGTVIGGITAGYSFVQGVRGANDTRNALNNAPRSQQAGIGAIGGFSSGAAIGGALGVGAVVSAALLGSKIGTAIPVPILGTLIGAGIGALVGVGMSAFGSGKGKGEKMRDGWRSHAQSLGIVDKDYNVTLRDGTQFELTDGENKYQNVGENVDGATDRFTYEVDFSNPLVEHTIPDAHLFAIATGLDPTSDEGFGMFQRITAQSLNAATSNAGSEDDVRENFRSMLKDVDKSQLSGRLEYLRVTDKISEEEYGVYMHRLGQLTGEEMRPTSRDDSLTSFIRSLEGIPPSERTSQHRELYRSLTDPKKTEESRRRLEERQRKEREARGQK